MIAFLSFFVFGKCSLLSRSLPDDRRERAAFESGVSRFHNGEKKLTFLFFYFLPRTHLHTPPLLLFLSLSLSLSLSLYLAQQNVSRASAAFSDAGDIPDRSGRSSFETSPGGSQHGANAFGGGGYFQNSGNNPELGRPSLARSSASGPSAARAPVMSGEWATRGKSLRNSNNRNIRASSAFSAKGHGSSAGGGGGGDDDGKGGVGVNPGEKQEKKKKSSFLSSFYLLSFFFLSSFFSSLSFFLLTSPTTTTAKPLFDNNNNKKRHLGLVPRRRRAPPALDHPPQRDGLPRLVPRHAAGVAVDGVLHPLRHRVLRGAWAG